MITGLIVLLACMAIVLITIYFSFDWLNHRINYLEDKLTKEQNKDEATLTKAEKFNMVISLSNCEFICRTFAKVLKMEKYKVNGIGEFQKDLMPKSAVIELLLKEAGYEWQNEKEQAGFKKTGTKT